MSGGGVDEGRRKKVRVDYVHHHGVVEMSVVEKVNVYKMKARMDMLNYTV